MNKIDLFKSDEDELKKLFQDFLKLKEKFDNAYLNQFKRSLPMNELLFDRWERAKNLNFGENTSIYDSSYVFGDVKIKNNTWIGPFTILDGSGGLEIGSYCSISAGVQIYSHNSVNWALSGGIANYQYSKTIIGNNCYIGPNSIISMGVVIEDNCVIGANSFVNKSFERGSKLAGNPAKLIQ